MKQIDQEPGSYRAQPLKREPVFAPGGLRRLGLWFLGLAICFAISIPLYFVFSPLAEQATNIILQR